MKELYINFINFKAMIRYKTRRLTYNILLFILMLVSASCTNFYFENPQPLDYENLTEFPKKLLGTYIDTEKGDTLISVLPDGFVVSLNGNDVKIPLSNKTILRKYKSFYFLNLRQEDLNLWTVYIVKPGKKKTFDLYDLSNETKPLEQLKSITEVRQSASEGDETVIFSLNPSLEELDQIIDHGLLKTTKKLKK